MGTIVRALLTLGLFAFTVFCLFHNLGGTHLTDWDEAIYANAAIDALKDGDYLAMKFREGIFWDKTPFPVMPVMLSFKLLGVNETAARLPSALFGLGTISMIFLVARRHYGYWPALLAVIVILTTEQLMFRHGLRSADIDSITLFFMTGAVTSWILVERVGLKVVLTMVCLAFVVLCKGPIVGIPAAVILSSLFVHNPLWKAGPRPVLIGAALCCLIVLPWYFYMYGRFGSEFLNNHVIRVYFNWFARGVDGHARGDMFLIDQVLLNPYEFVWFGAGLIALIHFFRLYGRQKKPVDLVMIAWAVITFLVIHGSQTKIAWYVFPLYLPLAVMIGKTLADFASAPDYLTRCAYCGGLIVVLSFAFSTGVLPGNPSTATARAGLMVLVLLGCSVLIDRFLPRWRGAFGVILLCALFAQPLARTVEITNYRTEPPVNQIIGDLDFREPVYTFGVNPSGTYYLSRRGEVRGFYKDSGDLRQLRGRLVVTRTDLLPQTPRNEAGATFEVLAGQESYRVTIVRTAPDFSLIRIE